MTFHSFAVSLFKIEETPSRLDMTALLADLYNNLVDREIILASYLMRGSLVPEYQSLEFNLSTKMVLRALAHLLPQDKQSNAPQDLFGNSDEASALDAVTLLYKQYGDIGEVAQEINTRRQASSSDLEITQVHQKLTEIAQDSGQGSQERKVQGLVSLLEQLSPLSARYLVRIVIGKLRLGFSTMTMLDSLSWAIAGDKSENKYLEAAFNRRADIGVLAQQYLAAKNESTEKRQEILQMIDVQLGVPVMPALCQRLNTSQEIVDKMAEVYAEPKYDGLRIQIHIDRKQKIVKAFTRNLDDVTHMFPELEKGFECLTAQQVILDGEAIGYDPETNSLRAFQDTITRRRKHDVAEQAEKIPMRFYLFDILMKDEEPLITKKLRKRKELLEGVINDNEVFLLTPYITTTDPTELRIFHEEQLAQGLEGAVLKRVDGEYTSGRKGWNWVKIKEEEGTTGKLADTLDCVVMGYYFGRGKRAQFGMGALLVGVYDAAQDAFVTIAKIGTGLSEKQLVDIKEAIDQIAVTQQPTQFQVPKELTPDVWALPQIVVEIAADELTNSPLHTASKALRFPRLKKVRDDKKPEQATALDELPDLA